LNAVDRAATRGRSGLLPSRRSHRGYLLYCGLSRRGAAGLRPFGLCRADRPLWRTKPANLLQIHRAARRGRRPCHGRRCRHRHRPKRLTGSKCITVPVGIMRPRDGVHPPTQVGRTAAPKRQARYAARPPGIFVPVQCSHCCELRGSPLPRAVTSPTANGSSGHIRAAAATCR
jgi:hypothetical protein